MRPEDYAVVVIGGGQASTLSADFVTLRQNT